MILVTGGERSGKSSFALEKALAAGEKRAFVATAEPFDGEMADRIKKHKEERKDLFETFEEPVHIDEILAKTATYDVCIVECLTTWLGNVIYRKLDPSVMTDELVGALNGNEIIVTNEVGMGVIPADAVTRKYVDDLGRLNARIAKMADEVYFMVSGIPVRVK